MLFRSLRVTLRLKVLRQPGEALSPQAQVAAAPPAVGGVRLRGVRLPGAVVGEDHSTGAPTAASAPR